MIIEISGKLEEQLISTAGQSSPSDLALDILNKHFLISPSEQERLIITELKCFSAFTASRTKFTIQEASLYYKASDDSFKALIDEKIAAMVAAGEFKNIQIVDDSYVVA